MRSLKKSELFDPYLGVLIVFLRAEYSTSLKDRRGVVRPLMEKIRGRWNVSVTDMGPDNERTDIVLAVSTVGSSVSAVEKSLEAVCSFLYKEEEHGNFDLLDCRQEVNRFEYISHGENQ